MAISIDNEWQVANEDFRAMIIEEIEGEENQSRKAESKKRYEIYRDQTKRYVEEAIRRDLLSGNDEINQQVYATVNEMCERASNISILKKIISKKAVLYKQDVKREIYDYNGNLLEDETKKMEDVYRAINANAAFKKVNKINEYQKNGPIMVRPYMEVDTGKFTYEMRPLQPYSFDVIENSQNPEEALVYILGTYKRRTNMQSSTLSEASRHHGTYLDFQSGDGTDQKIADSMIDEDSNDRSYIWWSKNYHFTTDSKGRLLTPGVENDFGILNFYDFATDKDGHFWAIGGDDLVDGSILINLLLTDLHYIQKYQGFGFFYAFAADMPEEISVGPRKGITGRLKEGDPPPTVGFANPSAPLGDHMKIIEQYLAFLLSTNNLEPGQISAQLTAARPDTAIQEMIRKAEPTDDIRDMEQFYRRGEQHLFEVVKAVHNTYLERGLLKDDLTRIGTFRYDTTMSVRFNPPEIYTSEKEKLEIMDMRRKLGIDTLLDTIKRDNPQLTDQEADSKLMTVLEERVNSAERSMREAIGAIPSKSPGQDGEETEEE